MPKKKLFRKRYGRRSVRVGSARVGNRADFAVFHDRKASAYDNIRRPAGPALFGKLLQSQIFNSVQVAHGEVSVVGNVVGKGLIGGIQDFRPLCAETASKSVPQLFRCSIIGNFEPDLVQVADRNQPARADSPGFIEVDRHGARRTARWAVVETGKAGKSFPFHRSENDKETPRGDIENSRQAAAAERH